MTYHRGLLRCRRPRRKSLATGAAILGLLISQATTPLGAAVQKEGTPAAESQAPVDGGWPRSYATAGGAGILIYQPQVASWDDQKHIVAFSAVSYLPKGAEKPSLGTIKLEADTQVSLEERLVSFISFEITDSNFPGLSREQVREILAEVQKAIPHEERVIALDRVLAQIDSSQIAPKNVEGVKADPPTVFFSKKPAVLVNFDGEPIWSSIQGNDLKFAVNTNWDAFQHGPSGTFYLRYNDTWLKAPDVKGPWGPAGDLPESFRQLPAEDNWAEVKANVPGKKVKASKLPRVFVSYTPAELILLQGEPKYETVEGTRLLWVSNSESDLFRLGKAGQVYYLVAGRWFSAPDFAGPWTFATPNLPEDFKTIPLEHPRSRVLASVPGSDEAAEAILLAQVPQTARVNIKQLKAPEVSYQGEPQFEPIAQTQVARAVNTDKDILKVGDLYYMCFQGVWFISTSPTGPWEVSTSVPGEIYEIPPSSSCHHVTYVTVEDDDKTDQWVTVAFVAGYTGMMIAWGVPVWGTGWYYPPYVWWGPYYPVYYPFVPTYGFSAWYNPWTGAYGRSAAVYGPYGGAGIAAAYNPSTGTYARGAAAWGPYGAAGWAQAYNPRTGAYAATRQGANVYGSWGSTYVQRGDDWARTARFTDAATGNTTRFTRTDEGGMASRRGPDGGGFVAAGEGGNVYAGKDGSIYRRQDGTWQKYDGGGGWSPVERPQPAPAGAAQTRDGSAAGSQRTGQPSAATRDIPSPSTLNRSEASASTAQARNLAAGGGTRASQWDSSTFGQLERDYSARAQGAQRTRDYSSYRNSGGRSGSTYRPSARSFGGGARRGRR